MPDKEVEINGKTIGENTEVKITIKTLVWIIGLLISGIVTLASVGYFNIKSEQRQMKDSFEKEKFQYREDIKNMINNELKDEVEKREILMKNIEDVRGDVKVILDRTKNLNNPTEINHEVSNTRRLPQVPK